MASWNVGPSRLNGVDNGLLDLKALLNQAIGGGIGSSLGGGMNNAAVGSGTSRGGGLPRIGSGGSSSGGGYGNSGGMMDGGLGTAFGNGSGGSSSNNSNGSFFDPFSAMSTFGFFNPKDPSSNMSMSNSCNAAPGSGMGGSSGMGGDRNSGMGGDRNSGMGGGGGNSGMGGDRNCGMGGGGNSGMGNDRNSGMGGGGGSSNHHMNSGMSSHSGMMRNGQSKSPTSYHSGNTNNSHSPAFPQSHSPTFFGGSSSNQQNNHYSSSSSNFSSSSSKFPISTFSIDDTLSGRSNNDSSSVFGNSDDNSQSNGHGNHYGNGSNSNSNSNNYQHQNSRDRDRDNHSSSNTFQSGGSSGSGNNQSSSSTTNRTNEHGDNSFNQGVRETGIIEKLLHSYGFIQCCERQARLFFHFSQFEGTIEHLKLGDPVEFEMTYDRRTGKPIASAVTKIGPEVVLSEERVTGTVTTELHHESNGELQGRISYENRGECFFLPYCQEDIEGNVTLRSGDTVSFQIATNQRSGNLTARYVRLENPARPVRYKGIVSSIKDNFGFIERADVAKEIFFHFSETRIHEGIIVSDNVEFNIQTRNGKEVACSITKLPHGTVVFEDIGGDMLKGQVLKPIDKSQVCETPIGPTPRSESMQGRLRYRGPDRQELEVVFGEKDQNGSFTMRHGDWVQFQLAVDRRDKQQRATNIALLEESFVVSGERREEGVISAVKDGCGYITCAERDSKMYFRFTEMLDLGRSPKIGDDIEFTIIQDPTSPVRQSAIRIKYLKPGAVQFEIPVSQGINGMVVREPSTPWVSQEALAGILPSLATLGLPKNVTDRLIQGLSSQEVLSQITGSGNDQQPGEPGLIQYQVNGWQRDTITFHWKDCKDLKNIRVATHIIFDIHQVRRNRDLVAANIRARDDVDSDSDSVTGSHSELSNLSQPQGLSFHQLAGALSSPQNNMHNTMVSAGLGSPTLNHPVSTSSSPDGRGDALSGLTAGLAGYLNSNMDKFPKQESGLMDSPTWSDITSSKDNDVLLKEQCVEDLLSNGAGRYDLQMNNSEGSVSSSPSSSVSSSSKNPRVVMKGYIAALKDGFGFIETMAQDGEIFFHSSSLVGDFSTLEVGQEVEYVVSSKASANGKNAADIVKPLPKGSIGRAAIFPDILSGVVSRPLRGANPDQSEYTGIIDGHDGRTYNFGIISMLNKKETLQAGEGVEFQLDAQGKPVNIRAVRKKLRATVEAVKGQYGFLSHELEDGKKLFFHMSEVKDHQHLNPGDEVEFVILQNPRNGKSSACSVVKIGESQRPERLLNRLSKLSVDESAPRLVVVRQPYGPDGTKGFSQPRSARKPGSIVSARESTSSSGSLN